MNPLFPNTGAPNEISGVGVASTLNKDKAEPDDSIDTGAIKVDLANQCPVLLDAFAKLGVTISDLQGQVATLKKRK